jgi:hypothetical protein
MINFGPKSKASKKLKAKTARTVFARVPRRPSGYFAVSPEEAAEMNMFSEAAAKMNVRADARRKAEAKALVKAKA